MSDFLEYLDQVMESTDLGSDEFARAFQVMCLGGATPAQISAFLTSYSIKGFAKQELEGMSKFLSFKLRTPIDSDDVFYVASDQNNQLISIILALILSEIHKNTVYISNSNSESFIGHIGINSMDTEDLSESLSQHKFGIHIINYKYMMRNIYDVAHEIGLDTMLDELLYFYTPTSNDMVIKLYDIDNKNLLPHIENRPDISTLELGHLKTSDSSKFHTQISILTRYLAKPTSEDFLDINSAILPLIAKVQTNHRYNSLEDLYNTINSGKLKAKLDYIIDKTNRA